mgnify:CR=1 FL=1
MYKGEANVPLHMLSSFIRAGESLKIKGLEVSATKQLEADGSTSNSQPTTVLPTPSSLASLTPTSMPSVSAATSLSHIFNGSKEANATKKMSCFDQILGYIHSASFKPFEFCQHLKHQVSRTFALSYFCKNCHRTACNLGF